MGEGSASGGSRPVAPIAPVLSLAHQQLNPELSRRCDGFLERYFEHLARADLMAREPRDLLGAALAHLRLGDQREPGTASVHVFNPDLVTAGWQSAHTVVQVVTDDMPFLVDSVRMVMTAMGLGIHLVLHPMLRVARARRSLRHLRERCRQRGVDVPRGRSLRHGAPGAARGAAAVGARRRQGRGHGLTGDARSVRAAGARARAQRAPARHGRGGEERSVPALAGRRQLHLPRLPRVRLHEGPVGRRRRGRGAGHRSRAAP